MTARTASPDGPATVGRMPQPKKPPTGQGAPTADDEDARSTLAALRDLLLLPRDRVRETVDDAVRRGRMTRDDAEELFQSLIAAGRRQTEDALADLEQLLGRQRVAKEVDRAKRAAGLSNGGAFPIEGYDNLTAGQITSRLDDLSPADLRKVRDYERKHGNRKTVLSAVERKLG